MKKVIGFVFLSVVGTAGASEVSLVDASKVINGEPTVIKAAESALRGVKICRDRKNCTK